LKRKKSKAYVNVYLLLQKEEKILFSLRQNTGYEDGLYSLVAGHVEELETATQAMIREAKEEIGISIAEEDLKMVHTMYRRTDRNNIDLFFVCECYQGEIQNEEVHKCGDLSFFSPENLPEHTILYISQAIENIINGVQFSEFGWSVYENT
jgi:ADP-ribose pyrophosphatase YjhB (NUDIX family)